MKYGKFGKESLGRTNNRASALAMAKQKAKQKADEAKEVGEKMKDPEYRKKLEAEQKVIQKNANFKAKVPPGAAAASGGGGGGGSAALDPNRPKTAEERGAAYKAHWASKWKATADQARARVAAEKKAAASKGGGATGAKNSSSVRRRGKGSGGGQFV